MQTVEQPQTNEAKNYDKDLCIINLYLRCVIVFDSDMIKTLCSAINTKDELKIKRLFPCNHQRHRKTFVMWPHYNLWIMCCEL